MQQGILAAHDMGMAGGAAEDAAQHVAAALVGGHDPIGDQEGGGAQVVGDHPVGNRVGTVGGGGRVLRRSLDQPAHEVDIVIVVLALEDGGDALQPHPGIDGGLRQVAARAAGDLVVLHEHQVPDLDEAVAVLIGRSRRTAGHVGAVIVEDFRAWPAGSGLAHGPEIIGTRYADDARIGQSGDLLPQGPGFVIAVIDGDHQAVLGQTQLVGQKAPGERDGALLEIIAEGEISQHLEEGVMARGVADILQIVVLAAGAHAFLGSRRARVIPGFGADEDVLELDHSGIGEQQCRIVVGHQRA